MKPFLNLIFLLISINLFSQEESHLPNYIMPSPQGHEITKYGDLAINESLGMVNHKIPLHIFKSGSLELPISLSYSGNGIKITDLPTWTGNNWTLNAGGVITRTVNDLPDETFNPRMFFAEGGLPAPIDMIELIENPDDYDTQSDIFNFSFAGVSGSFYLDVEVIPSQSAWDLPTKIIKPVIVNNENEYKIEVLGDFFYGDSYNYEFLITTTEGTKYYFGGLTVPNTEPSSYAVEETQFVDRTTSQPVFGKKAKTSFYLTKIEHFLGDAIYFEYHTKPEYGVWSIKNQKLPIDITPPFETELTSPVNTFLSDIIKINNKVFNGKYLKSIWGTSASAITFNSFEVQTSDQYYRVLSDINLNTKTVALEYFPSKNTLQTSQNRDKFVLEKVEFKDEIALNKEYEYNLEYDNIIFGLGQLQLNSLQQDYLGYYNNAGLNSNLIPQKHLQYIDNHLPNLNSYIENKLKYVSEEYALADREPKFNYAKIGTLTKINYPTGGYTKIDYEPVDKKVVTETAHMTIYSNMGNATPAWTPNSKYTDGYMIGEGVDGGPGPCVDCPYFEPSPPVFYTQTVKFNLDIKTLSANHLDHHDFIYLKITNLDANTSTIKKFYFPISVREASSTQTEFPRSFYYTLLGGRSYSFQIGFGDGAGNVNTQILNALNTDIFTNTGVRVDCVMKYVKGYDQNEGLGIRVKRLEDYKDSNSSPIIKRFYYKKAIDYLLPEAYVYSPFFLTSNKIKVEAIASGNGGPSSMIFGDFYSATINSNPFKTNIYNTNQLSYKYVTTSFGGNNFENGGIQKQFRNEVNLDSQNDESAEMLLQGYDTFVSKVTSISESQKTKGDDNNGKLEREFFISKKNDTLFKIKQTDYFYQYYQYNNMQNLAGTQMMFNNSTLALTSNNMDLVEGKYYFGIYNIRSLKPLLKRVKNISYIDPVPLIAYEPPVLQKGWFMQDDDGDGILNPDDEDFITQEVFETLTEDELEAPYNKVVTEESYAYSPIIAGLPSSVITTKSDGESIKIDNFYPIADHINLLTGLSSDQQLAYNILNNQNRISTPIQVNKSLVDSDNNEKVLSIKRLHYNANSLLDEIKTAKGGLVYNLESKVKFSYDNNGNCKQVLQPDGQSTLYFWSSRRTVLVAIKNCNYETYQSVSGGLVIDENTPVSDIISLSNLLPNSQVYKYDYLPNTDYLNKITDARGRTIYYEYDEFYRLKFVRDHEGNILSKKDYNYITEN
ncbi:hypothetical protein [Olleya sp.]|jgi:hypothetical protein|uniref:hypothetical protein n=1 Tax=Olleya sp. TaxID=1906788 RepID=UPI0032D91BEA